MLFALGRASGSGPVPSRAGLIWHPWLQRLIMGLRLVRTPGAVPGLGPGDEGHVWSWSAGQIASGGWVMGTEWGQGPGRHRQGGHSWGPGRRSPWVVQIGRVSTRGIDTRLGRSIGSEMPEKLRIASEHRILSSLSRQPPPSSAGRWTSRPLRSTSAEATEAQQGGMTPDITQPVCRRRNSDSDSLGAFPHPAPPCGSSGDSSPWIACEKAGWNPGPVTFSVTLGKPL